MGITGLSNITLKIILFRNPKVNSPKPENACVFLFALAFLVNDSWTGLRGRTRLHPFSGVEGLVCVVLWNGQFHDVLMVLF